MSYLARYHTCKSKQSPQMKTVFKKSNCMAVKGGFLVEAYHFFIARSHFVWRFSYIFELYNKLLSTIRTYIIFQRKKLR